MTDKNNVYFSPMPAPGHDAPPPLRRRRKKGCLVVLLAFLLCVVLPLAGLFFAFGYSGGRETKPKYYTMTLHYSDEIQEERVRTNETYHLPVLSEYKGLPVDGWYTNKSLSSAPITSIAVTCDMRFYLGTYFVTDGLRYRTDDASGGYKLIGWETTTTELVVPDIINDVPVTAIGQFWGSPITKLTIGNNVTRIAPQTFIRLYNLKEVILPDGILEIGDGAFQGCRSLEQVNLPEGLVKIGTSAFAGTNLTKVHLPASLYYLGNTAFSNVNGERIRFTVAAGSTRFAASGSTVYPI